MYLKNNKVRGRTCTGSLEYYDITCITVYDLELYQKLWRGKVWSSIYIYRNYKKRRKVGTSDHDHQNQHTKSSTVAFSTEQAPTLTKIPSFMRNLLKMNVSIYYFAYTMQDVRSRCFSNESHQAHRNLTHWDYAYIIPHA